MLAGRLGKKHRRRGGYVKGVNVSVHRDRHDEIALVKHEAGDSLALAAEDYSAGTRKIGIVISLSAAFRRIYPDLFRQKKTGTEYLRYSS